VVYWRTLAISQNGTMIVKAVLGRMRKRSGRGLMEISHNLLRGTEENYGTLRLDRVPAET
jgi:hypothetical protein